MLVLGSCLKPDSDEECKTDKIVKALELGGRNPILSLGLRNECRRLYDETGCKSISENELEVLLASKALEIQIAIQELDITVDRVFCFSPCWDHNRWDEILDALRLDPPPYYHETRHIPWMQHTALEFCADKVSQTVMQNWSGAQIMETSRKSGLLRGGEVSRIPTDFAAKYREMNDDLGFLEALDGQRPVL